MMNPDPPPELDGTIPPEPTIQQALQLVARHAVEGAKPPFERLAGALLHLAGWGELGLGMAPDGTWTVTLIRPTPQGPRVAQQAQGATLWDAWQTILPRLLLEAAPACQQHLLALQPAVAQQACQQPAGPSPELIREVLDPGPALAPTVPPPADPAASPETP